MRQKQFSRMFAFALSGTMILTAYPAVVKASAPTNETTKIVTQKENQEEYTYVYAGLTWNEYWASEGVYAAGNTSSSSELDSKGESDKGGYDVVSRATTNHGLHRGSFQCMAKMYTEDGNTYEVSHWSTDGKILYLTDGTHVSYAKGVITGEDGEGHILKDYEVTGIKYVPVAVKTADLDSFKEKYQVVENDGNLTGGYGEQQLVAYTATANVTPDTNGLKTVTKNNDGTFSFSKRQTGTESGIKDSIEKKAENITTTVKDASGSYGEFLRVDLTGTGYGALGSNMQAVKWTYYGNDSTYSKALDSYGTKFAADNWMHKSMGIQLGLTDSVRCRLPEGYDGRGYWELTVYALGYEDYTVQFQATADNIVYSADDGQKADTTKLTETVNKAKKLSHDSYCSGKQWDDMLSELQEAEEVLAEPRAQAVVDEAKEYLQSAMDALLKHEIKTSVKAATFLADGTITETCSVCGHTKSTAIAKINSVKLNKTAFTYNKKTQTPTVTVTDKKGKNIASSNYSLTFSKASVNPGAYTLTVNFKGNYRGTKSYTYTIVPAKNTVKLSKAKKTSLKATWTKVAGITGYQIQYGTSSKFKGAKTVAVKSTSKTISKLKKNKKYYVRVRSYKTAKVNGKNTNLYSAWSASKKLKI
ncbi:MAG: penicillin-binding Tp47 domain C-containing protein [Anaerostipes sp.]|nr:penicillin-binding Tp47 domain C-containing protein [Anaerostipes sp.]